MPLRVNVYCNYSDTVLHGLAWSPLQCLPGAYAVELLQFLLFHGTLQLFIRGGMVAA
jgi:hypothetical protein